MCHLGASKVARFRDGLPVCGQGSDDMRRNALWCVGLVFGLLACGENLDPVKAAWTTVNGTVASRVGEWKKSYGEAQAALKTLPSAGTDDAAGNAIRNQLDSALAREARAIADAEALMSEARTSYEQALNTRKVASVQKVVDDTNARFMTAEKVFSASTAQSSSLLGQLRGRLARSGSPAETSAGH